MISILKDCNKRIIALVCPLKSSSFFEPAQPDKMHSWAMNYYYLKELPSIYMNINNMQ